MNEKEFAKIEAYIKGRLAKKDKVAFEEELKNDPKLADQVGFVKDIANVTEIVEDQKIADLLSTTEEELLGQGFFEDVNNYPHKKEGEQLKSKDTQEEVSGTLQRKIKSLLFSNWRIAASLVLLITLGGYYLYRMGQSHSGDLFNKYVQQVSYSPFSDWITMGSNSDLSPEQMASVSKITEIINQKDYEEAINLLKQIPRKDTLFSEAQFNIAYVNFTRRRYQEAITGFRNLPSASFGNLRDYRDWYLVLSLLKTGDKEEAFREIDKIIEAPGHSFNDNASNLRSELVPKL